MAHGHLLTGRKSAKNPPHSVARVSLPAVVDGSGTTGGLGHGAALLLPRPSATPASTSPLAPAQGGGGGAADAAAVGGGGLSGCRRRSLWIGGLINWMDEDYLRSCFTRSPELVSVVIKRNKQTRQSEGYGFLNFDDHVAADQILKSYNGQQMPDSSKHFRLNWVTHTPPPPAAAADTHTDPTTDHTIYVGNLAYDVTDYMLHHVFKSRYSSIKTANVVCDKSTGRSKGYAFVLFGDANERTQAMTEMNGAYCSTRPIRICPVTNKKSLSHDAEGSDSDCNPNDSRLFIGSLDPSVTDEDLMEAFGAYGELVNVKVITGKQVGFVKYSSRIDGMVACMDSPNALVLILIGVLRILTSRTIQRIQDMDMTNRGGMLLPCFSFSCANSCVA
uniref:RRM domain-containing protein n=1 Tax=Leersia perrieri TaxID=77586 RepID=A0A0D9WUJ2_9ORYZ